MPDPHPPRRFRFGAFEADAGTGELRRKGLRLKLHAQPFQLLVLLLSRPGEIVTRDDIARQLWPDGTFVDFEHGVNSAVNRLRDALSDRAANPRFVETVARRGYRFIAPVEVLAPQSSAAASHPPQAPSPLSSFRSEAQEAEVVSPPDSSEPPHFLDQLLASADDLPASPHRTVRTLFLLLQLMYLGFYVGALANLAEIADLMAPLTFAAQAYFVMIVSAALLIPVRIFLLCAVLFYAPRLRAQFRTLWWFLLPLDVLWSLAPFLLLHHIPWGLALACVPPLVYSPFAQRALILMGAATPPSPATPATSLSGSS